MFLKDLINEFEFDDIIIENVKCKKNFFIKCILCSCIYNIDFKSVWFYWFMGKNDYKNS